MVKVIEKNNDFIVVYKPAGAGFHDENGVRGFFNVVRDELKMELYPVHRLDRMTSGLIVFARTREAAHKLAQLFQLREVSKYYIALSEKRPTKKMGRITGGMERTRNGQWKLTRDTLNLAKTLFVSVKLTNGLTLFVVRPLTGRTHQIRVALKSVGAPIIGDPLYTPASGGADRGYLHAWAISFRFRGRRYFFKALPDTGELFLHPAFSEVINEKTLPDSFNYLNNQG